MWLVSYFPQYFCCVQFLYLCSWLFLAFPQMQASQPTASGCVHIRKRQAKLAETILHNFIPPLSNLSCLQPSPHQSYCHCGMNNTSFHLLPTWGMGLAPLHCMEQWQSWWKNGLIVRGVPHLHSTPPNAEISGPQCPGTAYMLNSNTMSQGIHGKGCF